MSLTPGKITWEWTFKTMNESMYLLLKVVSFQLAMLVTFCFDCCLCCLHTYVFCWYPTPKIHPFSNLWNFTKMDSPSWTKWNLQIRDVFLFTLFFSNGGPRKWWFPSSESAFANLAKSLEVQDQTKWLVFRMIHIKDSLLPMGKVWSPRTPWEMFPTFWRGHFLPAFTSGNHWDNWSSGAFVGSHHEWYDQELIWFSWFWWSWWWVVDMCNVSYCVF